MGVYIKKIEELKKHGTPIENRQYEARTRPNAMTMLQKTIEKYTSWVNSSQGDAAFAHITDDERATCSDKLDKSSAWMYDTLDKQGSLAANVDPAVTVEQIYGTNKELNDTTSPIMNKPKPVPTAKVEEKKQDDSAASEEQKKEEEPKNEEDSAPEPMDTSEPMEAS